MYQHDGDFVKPSSPPPPVEIVVMTCGERVSWQAHEFASNSHAIYRWVGDMVGLGWTAMRDGDAMIMHPVAVDAQATFAGSPS